MGTVGGLAMTGANVVWWSVAGVALLVGGAFLVHANRRRTRLAPAAPGVLPAATHEPAAAHEPAATSRPATRTGVVRAAADQPPTRLGRPEGAGRPSRRIEGTPSDEALSGTLPIDQVRPEADGGQPA